MEIEFNITETVIACQGGLNYNISILSKMEKDKSYHEITKT